MYEGPLAKNKSGRKLYGYLFNDLLLLVEPKKQSTTTTTTTSNSTALSKGHYCLYEKPIPLNEMIVRQVPSNAKDVGTVDDMSWQIVHLEKVITVRSCNESEKKVWMNHIQSCISTLEKKMQTDSSQSQEISLPHQKMIGTLEIQLIEGKKLSGSDKIRMFLTIYSKI